MNIVREITESSNISTPSSFEVEIRKHYVNETLPTNETPIVISPNHFNVLSGSPFCLPSPKSQLENAKVEILVSKQNSVEAMRIWINSGSLIYNIANVTVIHLILFVR